MLDNSTYGFKLMLHRSPVNALALTTIVVIQSILAYAVAAREGLKNTTETTVLTATSRIRVSETSDDQVSVFFSLRVPAICIEAFHPGPERGVIILKPVVGNQACVFSPNQKDLVDAMRGQNISFHVAKPTFAELRRASQKRQYSYLVDTTFDLERRERPFNPHNIDPSNYSSIVFLEHEPSTSLVDISCFPKSQNHHLCPFHMQPRSTIAVEARVQFKDLNRWRELVAQIEHFVSQSAQ